jgi:hypothetical protein
VADPQILADTPRQRQGLAAGLAGTEPVAQCLDTESRHYSPSDPMAGPACQGAAAAAWRAGTGRSADP